MKAGYARASARGWMEVSMGDVRRRHGAARLLVIGVLLGGCTAMKELPRASAPPAGGPAVVFDIDGTLTPRKLKFEVARPGASCVANVYAAKGYSIVYLTARPNPPFFCWKPVEELTKDWLREKGFPDGRVDVSTSLEDVSDPQAFKTKELDRLINKEKYDFKFAYGDQISDFNAYKAVGIPSESIFALQREDEHDCDGSSQHLYSKCLNDFREQLGDVVELPSLKK